jgi:uncharacterized membrane protein
MNTQEQPAYSRVAGISPSRKLRLFLLLPILIGSVLFWAPVGIITILKMQSFDMITPYWLGVLGLSVTSLFVKGFQYWVIYVALIALTVLKAIGGMKFFGSMNGMH